MNMTYAVYVETPTSISYFPNLPIYPADSKLHPIREPHVLTEPFKIHWAKKAWKKMQDAQLSCCRLEWNISMIQGIQLDDMGKLQAMLLCLEPVSFT